VAIFVMKQSPYRYTAHIRRIQLDDRMMANRNERAMNLAQNFVRELEKILQKYPEQWFNYYEFWSHDGE